MNATPLIICGLTTQGSRFRPSDWAERLAGAFAVVDPNHRTNYSPYVRPGKHNGIPCLFVDKQLKERDPSAYRFLVGFAAENDLVVENGD